MLPVWPFACGDSVLYDRNNEGIKLLLLTSPLSHFEDYRRKRWCAVVILLAVCSLIVSLATRYSTSLDDSSPTVKAVQAHPFPAAKRQRLAKDAANWIRPMICFEALEAPSYYPPIAPAGPPIPIRFLEESLYNRPPPSSELLS